MLGIFISSLLFLEKRRRIYNIIPDSFQDYLTEWEPRVLVVLSLLLQVILIFLGARRKYSCSSWLKVILWFSYLSADMVAITALGAISNSQGHPGTGNSDITITALWAPFLLLHLGGPDTITAYALEDNELWPRHFFGLVQQVLLASYVLIKSWDSATRASIITVFMFIPGVVKYGERTWVLRFASKEHFKNSMLDPPEPGLNYAKFMKEYVNEQAEGHEVRVELQKYDQQRTQDKEEEAEAEAEEQAEEEADRAGSSGCAFLRLLGRWNCVAACFQLGGRGPDLDDAEVLSDAYDFFLSSKRLFAGLILSGQDWETARDFFQESSPRRAFKVIEVELGLVYDLLYSKAPLVYSTVGLILRSISFLSIITLLLAFLTGDYNADSADLVITYILFIGASILEICAIFILISSDRAFLWLMKQQVHIPLVTIALEKTLSSRKRWSDLVAQYNLIDVCIGQDRPPKILPEKVQRFLGVDELLEDYYYIYSKKVPSKSKEFIFKELLRKSIKVEKIEDIKNLWTSTRGGSLIENSIHLRDKLQWSLNDVEFDQSILLWHIATDLCYEYDNDISLPLTELRRETSKLLSDYMLYLLIKCPFMLPEGNGRITFRDTRLEAEIFFRDANSELGRSRTEACEQLLEVNTDIRPVEVKGEKSKSVLFDACRLAKTLQSFDADKFDKWEIMNLVWIQMLAYAASQCKGTNHARQLRQGGEFITHIWLLMAHLGIIELFSKTNVEAMLVFA